jgi:hypothetical protein
MTVMDGYKYISLLQLSPSEYTRTAANIYIITKSQLPTILVHLNCTMATMKAIGVSKYGPVDNLESRDVPKPSDPTGRQVVVKFVT